MVKQILPAIAIIILLGSCSSLKPLSFANNKPLATAPVVNAPGPTASKFIDNITVTPQATTANAENSPAKKETFSTSGLSIEETTVKEEPKSIIDIYANHNAEVESVTAIQLKYAILMNTEVEQVQNKPLFQGIDEWYGCRYRMGGTTKKGVDCSAFVGAIFAAVYGVSLPRTARDQYRITRRIPRTELQEGDLLFFNTRGGVSHVGIYLQNNKFIHASTSKGVTISDMYETYYLKRFIGAGRIENKQGPVAMY